MSYRLLRTEQASRQLMEIGVYIAEESGSVETALNVLQEMEEALERLKDAPHMGSLPRAETLRRQGHRFLVIRNYLAFYRCDDAEKVVILTAVVHSKQDYRRVLL